MAVQRSTACAAWLAALMLWAGPALAPALHPNVVVILADDLGGTIGGQGVPTPNINALAAGGVTFTTAYASPVCRPSRAKLLSGRQEQELGIYWNATTPEAQAMFGLPVGVPTLADALGALGYATGIFGKWHLGILPQFRPLVRGFDEGHYVLRSDAPYLPPNDPDNPFYHDGVEVAEARPTTAAFATEAAAFIHRHASGPFFAYVPFSAVHGPYACTADQIARVPASVAAKRRPFACVLIGLDDAVGVIIRQIHDEGLKSSTIVAFFGDNGCVGPGCVDGGLRSGKGSKYEGGVRVPFALSWPGTLAPRTVTAPISTADLFPTFLAAAGAAIPVDLDGVNLLPLATSGVGRPHACLAWGYKNLGGGAIRCGDWKLLWGTELYNLRTDPGETRNVAASRPAKVAELKAKRLPIVASWRPPLW